MEISNYVFIFAAKLVIYFIMAKKIDVEMTAVDLRDYYQGLSKKDRGFLLRAMVAKYGMGYSTIQSKFMGRHPFTQMEVMAVTDLINSGVWTE